MSQDLIKYKSIKVGDLLKSESFRGNHATVLGKRLEWELLPTTCEYVEWGMIQVIDCYGDVFWFEADEHDVYLCYHPDTKELITQSEDK